MIESEDLAAALKAAQATAASDSAKLREAEETERQNTWRDLSATQARKRRCKAAQASLAQAQANLDHQQADTSRERLRSLSREL